jgi:hypothetical protein
MPDTDRKIRATKAAEFRSKIATLFSCRIYELRTQKKDLRTIIKELNKLFRIRSQADPQNTHNYRTVLKRVINDISDPYNL